MTDREQAAMNLDVVAATAKKLAADLRSGRLWPGEASSAMDQIIRAANEARKEIGHDR